MRGTPRRSRDEYGTEFSRIVAFSDGVFAIAITLLVLQIHIPEHLSNETVFDALDDQSGDLAAYAVSFAVIGRLWLVHHRFFAEIIHFDGVLMTLNLVYLGFVVLIPFSSEVLGDHGDTTAGVILYALNLAVVNLLGTWLFLYAARAGLAREGFVRLVSDPKRLRNLLGAAVFLLSIPVALLSPTVAVLMWIAVFFAPRGDTDEAESPPAA